MSRSSKIPSQLHSIAIYSFPFKGVARKKIGYRGCSRRWSQLPEKLGAGVFLAEAASDKHRDGFLDHCVFFDESGVFFC